MQRILAGLLRKVMGVLRLSTENKIIQKEIKFLQISLKRRGNLTSDFETIKRNANF